MKTDEALRILQNGVLNGKDDTPENNEAIALAIDALKRVDVLNAELKARDGLVDKLETRVAELLGGV